MVSSERARAVAGLGLLAGLAAVGCGQPVAVAPTLRPDQTVQIARYVKPEYPARAFAEGAPPGAVRLLIEVDEFGQLADLLVTAYTRKDFAKASVLAVKQWRFRPTRHEGRPRPTVMDIEFNFGVQETVFIDRKDPSEGMRSHLLSERDFIFAPRGREELDRPLRPVSRVAPAYPKALKEGGIGGVVRVDFYVDEEGRTRFPDIIGTVDETLRFAALQAVRQWRFDPPRWRGSPALARVSQSFNFVPDTLGYRPER